jgi:hypothetical protein
MAGLYQQLQGVPQRRVSAPMLTLGILLAAVVVGLFVVLRSDKKSPAAKAANCTGTVGLEVAVTQAVSAPCRD